MKHQQGLFQASDFFRLILLIKIVQKLLFDFKGPARQLDLGLTPLFNLIDLAIKLLYHVQRIRRRADSCHPFHLLHGMGCRQHRRPAKAMANQQRWRTVVFTQKIGCQHQVIYIR